MIFPDKNQIEEVADDLDAGFVCYFNVITGEIESVLDQNRWENEEADIWDEILDKIEQNINDYWKFDRMSPYEAFKIMADFAKTIHNSRFSEVLIKALKSKDSFANFKNEIDNSKEFKQLWYDYNNQRYIQWVENQLEAFKASLNE